MKTNARKILSLILSFLMVFGSVATLLPTTVMAAETDATTDSTTIDCVIFDAGDILVADSIPKTKISYISGEETKTHSHGAFTLGNVKKSGVTAEGYVRFVPDDLTGENTGNVLVSTATAFDSDGFATSGIKYSDYKYFTIAYRTNVAANNLNVTLCTTAGTYSGTENKIFLSDTMGSRVSDGTMQKKTVLVPKSRGETQEIIGMFLKLYGTENQKALADGDYFDIQYIGFFKSEEDAAKFDYETYATKTVTVVTDDGNKTVSAVLGTTVDLHEETGLPYTNEDGDFLTLVDEDDNIYLATDFTVTDDITLKPNYSAIHYRDAKDFYYEADISGVGQLSKVGDNKILTDDGYLSVVLDIAGHTAQSYVDFILPDTSAVFNTTPVFALGYRSNISSIKEHTLGLTVFTKIGSYSGNFFDMGGKVYYDETPHKLVVDWSGKNSSSLNDKGKPTIDQDKPIINGEEQPPAYFRGIRFLPWGNKTGNKTWYEMYEGETFDFNYIALFATVGEANAFDRDAYLDSLENNRFVTLNDKDGSEYSVNYVAKGGEFIFPDYTETSDDVVFAGWKSDANETVVYEAGDKLTVTENVSFTAMLIDKFTVTLLDTDGTSKLYSDKIVDGSVIDLSELAEISYRNADSDFLVWTDEDETNIYSDTYEVTGDITLKAKYETVNVILAEQLMDIFTDTVNTFLEPDTAALKDGKYVHFNHNVVSGTIFKEKDHRNVNGHRMEYKKWEETPVENVGSVSISYVTNKPNVSFLQFYNPVSKAFVTKSNMTDIGTSTVVDGLYYRTAVYDTKDHYQAADYTADTDGNKYFAGFKFAPFSGNAIANIGHSEETLKDENGNDMYDTHSKSGKIIYSEYYYDPFVDIEYMAMFKGGPDVASAFDFDKYVDSLSYTVKFLDKYGDQIGDEETYGFWEEIILPEAPELPGHTFKGWYSVADEKLIEDDRDIVFRDNTYIARYTRDTLVLTAKDIVDNSLASVGKDSNLSCNGLVSSIDANGYSSQYVRFVVKADAIDGTTTSTNDDLALIDFEKYNIVYGNKLRDTENDYNCVRIGYKTNIDSYNDIINSRNYIGGGAYTALIKNTEGQVTGQDTKFYFSVSNTSSNEIKYHIEKFKELAYGTGYDEDGNFVTTTTADMKPYVEKFGFLPYGDSSKGASELSSDHYFDIEYIAFFATQEEADAFDYADYSANLITSVKLVALIGRDAKGYFTVGDSSAEETQYTGFVSENEAITLTAVPNDGHFPAYWVRFTQDDTLTQVLLTTEATVEAYPLGGSVYYQPVFVEVGTPVELYINKATREIIPADEVANYDAVENAKFSTDDVKVFDCTKKEEVEHNNPFIVYELGSETPVEIPEEFANPAFGDSVVINKSDENTAPKWTVELGEKVYTASYKNSFLFSYMFEAGTEVVVRENQLGDKAATPAISTVATWTEGNITRFTGLFALPNGYELINHGVMMSQDYEHLEALEDNETGELNVTPTTIVGRVSNNGEDAAPLFTIAKRLSLGTETWYGRAFLVYTDSETTYVVYANDILSSGIEAGEAEADYNYNPEVYNPMYWDDTIIVPAV